MRRRHFCRTTKLNEKDMPAQLHQRIRAPPRAVDIIIFTMSMLMRHAIRADARAWSMRCARARAAFD